MVMPDFSALSRTAPLVMLGCGKMGLALVRGWLAGGLSPSLIYILEPSPAPALEALVRAHDGVSLNELPAPAPALCVLAVKPQVMWQALERVKHFGGGQCCFLSIAAGLRIEALEAHLGGGATPIIRAMPNTPAAIGKGMTALVGNGAVGASQWGLAESLLATVGGVVRLKNEAEMDAVTAISGSGPAYIFHFMEAMIEAGVAEGLSPALAKALVLGTCEGAVALVRAEEGEEDVGRLRENVTSPGGTTAAALGVLMDEGHGFRPLMRDAVRAAALRSKELSEESEG